MLVLTRKNKEVIMINDDVKITVLNVSNGQVKLGFDAPKDVTIYRKEIYDKVNECLCDSDSKESSNDEEQVKV